MAARDAHSAPGLFAQSTCVPTESALLEKRQSLGLTAMDALPVRLAILQQPRLCARLDLWLPRRNNYSNNYYRLGFNKEKLKQRTSRTEISLMLCQKIYKYQPAVNAAMDL
jgi:hypothetical protein